jgi:hypothetical protein
MRAHTITTLALALCALAIPASAAAQPIDSVGHYSSESTQPSQGEDYSSVNSIVPPESQSGTAHEVDSGYASLNAITGPPDEQPTAVSGPAGENDGFDWASALVGAGTALAVAAFGGVALLTLRRRTAISPSASMS